MDRTNQSVEEGTNGLPSLLDGLNIATNERSINSSFWSPDAAFTRNADTPQTSGPNVLRSPLSSPSVSVTRSQASTPRIITSTENDGGVSLPQFDPPSLRSIFASGQPTSSISANTARASMSTISPRNASRPFAALTNASAGRRRDSRPSEAVSTSEFIPPSAQYPVTIPEKDIDDPTMNQQNSFPEGSSATTSQAVSNLFITSETTPPGQLSREPTYERHVSNMAGTSGDSSTLVGHLLHLGFEEGRHSDITIKSFGKRYRLHKILLERVPYFSSAFCGPWAESSATEMTLLPEDIDSNITQTAFELALRRIYGGAAPLQEEQEAVGLFATACWLDMPDLVESCIEHILRQMRPQNLYALIRIVTNSYYGKAGDRLLSSAKAMLCRDGWEMPFEYWDNIPADIVREIIGGDPFYISSEWERWYLTTRVLNRRLRRLAIEQGLVSADGRYLCSQPLRLRSAAVRPGRAPRFKRGARTEAIDDKAWRALYTHAEVAPILTLLDEGIHYVHLQFEQLQHIRSQRDILGIPVLPDKVISDALWMSMEIRQRVLGAHEGDLELGLSEFADADDEEEEEEVEEEDDRPQTPIARAPSSKGKQREHSRDTTPTDTDSKTSVPDSGPRKFWIPSNDVSCVMGGSREAHTNVSFSSPGEVSTSILQRASATPDITDSAWAADLGSSLFEGFSTSRSLVTQSPPRYSQYPPFRFCAEFPNPRTLKERKRVYSQTVWYAGSLWNLYIQRVNVHKNQQLGIYLHRAKEKDPSDDPLGLTVDDRIGQLEREMLLRRGDRRSRQWRAETPNLVELESDPSQSISLDYESSPGTQPRSEARPHKTSQSPVQARSSSTSQANASNDMIPLSDDSCDPPLRHHLPCPTIPPYADGRTTIKTYFKIYSPSKGGRLLSVYESAPDSFHFGKSWGWKSSWMVLDEGLEGKDGVKFAGLSAGDGKLRYMVVIGNV